MQRFALVPWRELIRRFLHAVMHEAQAALARQQEARGNQGLHRSAWRPPQHPLQYAIVAAAACGAGDAQYVALWRGQARQAVDHQLGDIVGVTVPGHGLWAPRPTHGLGIEEE